MFTNCSPLKFFISLLVSMLLSFFGRGQDLHFSQFTHAPTLLNPTETGNYFGDWRLVNNYRKQWGQIGKPMESISVSYDRQIYIFNQKLSVGGTIVHDESGNFKLYHQKAMLSAAYHQRIGRQVFRIGIQGAIVQKRLKTGGITFPDQWDMGIGLFNATLATQEQQSGPTINYFDFNAGIAYSRPIKMITADFSYAIFHFNRSNETFQQNFNPLALRHVFVVKTPFKLNDRWSSEPQLLYMRQNKAVDLVLAAYFNYKLANNSLKAQYAFGALSNRNSVTQNWDAFIFTTGIQFRKLRAAMSYDITVSKLRIANSYQGAYEFAIIYTGLSSVLAKRTIPCQRM